MSMLDADDWEELLPARSARRWFRDGTQARIRLVLAERTPASKRRAFCGCGSPEVSRGRSGLTGNPL
jgi:hypothetical protein